MPERRETNRVDSTIPLTIKLLGTTPPPPPITVETDDISPKGLSIVIKIKTKLENGRLSIEGEESQKMVKYLLLDNKQLALGIKILPHGGSIQAIGTVKWCYRNLSMGLYYVKAGVLIEEMARENKEKWMEFLKTAYQFLVCLDPRKG